MISCEITDGFGIALGVDWLRWYVGVSYETQQPNVRAFVFRLGPFYLHVIAS
jgi:hypothetical protein